VSKDTRLSETDRSAAKMVAELFPGETLDSMIKDVVKEDGPGAGVESLLNGTSRTGSPGAGSSSQQQHRSSTTPAEP
jgi:hypothetical protein